ncbi:hypothetical protein LNO81_25875 [Klebsiella variicola subsp. variicola]|nr:hypothetical protein [Klebsiella variicola subsp. variicola]
MAERLRSIVHHLFKLEAEVGAVSEAGTLRDIADLQVGVCQQIDSDIEFARSMNFLKLMPKADLKVRENQDFDH